MCARVFQQGVVVGRLDWREVAMCDPFRPRKLGDVVGDRAQRQIDDLAWIGRDMPAESYREEEAMCVTVWASSEEAASDGIALIRITSMRATTRHGMAMTTPASTSIR